MAVVTGLWTHPVKGCAGVALSEAVMTEAGLAHDRSFMVVSEGGVFLSQRKEPRFALIRPEISADGAELVLHAPGRDPVSVEVDLAAPRRDVELFGVGFRGIDQGEVVARWLSDVVGRPCRLVRVPPEHDRAAGGLTPGTSGYADSCAVLLTSATSLAGLNERIGGAGVPMNRFRPNIVIDGWAEPHREDDIRRMTIGDCELGYGKIAIRCLVTLVDQETGVRSGAEPLRTLATYRRHPDGGVAFGTKFNVIRPGKLALGDTVNVTTWNAE